MINISYVYFNVWIIVSHSCHTCNKFSVPNPQFLTQNATDTKKKNNNKTHAVQCVWETEQKTNIHC